MVFFILEAHGALHFCRSVNKCAQLVAGQRMIVAAGVYIFELAGFRIVALSVNTLEEKAFNFIGGVECVAFFFVHLLGKNLERSPNISAVRRAALVNDFAKNQD